MAKRTDTLSPKQRSARMALIRHKHTKPELAVRRLIHSLGYRYRLHGRGLPGTPDLVFRSRRKVIFVHGCFWHLHAGCRNNRPPKSRASFWLPKLRGNRGRDRRNRREIAKMGWQSLVIWECELDDLKALTDRVIEFLE
ncbi:MAG: very short patch repair endonuclease [Pirellulales bacterium]